MNRLALSIRGMVALLLIAGGILHGLGFAAAVDALLASGLSPLMVGSFKLLWLADSANLVATAFLAAYLTMRPAAATRIVVVIASIPVALTGLMSIAWMPGFYAGPLLVTAAALLAMSAIGGQRPASCTA